MRRGTIAAAIVPILLAGCARGTASGSGSTGVEGIVLEGPTCPVERADSPCPPRALRDVVLRIVDVSGSQVATTTSGPDGRFRIGLEPGAYQILAEVRTEGIGFAKPLAVTVPEHGFAHATVWVDTGIRMPVAGTG